MFTHAYTHVSVGMHTCTCIWKRICVYTYMYICIYTYTYSLHACINHKPTYLPACLPTDTYIHTYIHTYLHIHTYVRAYIHAYRDTYMHTCIPTSTHPHAYMHVRASQILNKLTFLSSLTVHSHVQLSWGLRLGTMFRSHGDEHRGLAQGHHLEDCVGLWMVEGVTEGNDLRPS